MTDRPILFSAPMVRALLAGTKTQTRRVLPSFFQESASGPEWEARKGADGVWRIEAPDAAPLKLPVRFAVGDRLYVREHWRTIIVYDGTAPRDLLPGRRLAYDADGHQPWASGVAGRFRQGMHMPKWASRLTLHVTEVRVQRLMDISETDAIAEGIQVQGDGWSDYPPGQAIWPAPRDSYFSLWDSINGQSAHAENPWVVAVTFDIERCNIAEARAA